MGTDEMEDELENIINESVQRPVLREMIPFPSPPTSKIRRTIFESPQSDKVTHLNSNNEAGVEVGSGRTVLLKMLG